MAMMMDAFWTAKAEDTSLIVRLYCADTKCYLRVNKNGRLFADVPQEDPSKLTDETEFLLHRVRAIAGAPSRSALTAPPS